MNHIQNQDTRLDSNLTRESLPQRIDLNPQLSLDRLYGIMLGVALGDSLGLPVETLTKGQIADTFGRLTTFQSLEHNSYLKAHAAPIGTISDDAQLTAAIFKAYIQAGGFSLSSICEQHIAAYRESSLGWGGSTIAGVKALMSGHSPNDPEFKSLLKTGTGNGIPMKVSAVGAWIANHPCDNSELLRQIQQICSISHPTSISVSAGIAQVAALLYCLSRDQTTFMVDEFVAIVVEASALGRDCYPETRTEDDLTARLATLKDVYLKSDDEIIAAFGGGDCYVYNSLPFSYAFFLKAPSSIETLYDIINAGGDTDSNAAMVGALQGALMGKDFFPQHLVAEIRGVQSLIDIAESFYDICLQTP
jgi:ADP-ribosylglycohydrolase